MRRVLTALVFAFIWGTIGISAQVYDYVVAKDGSGDFETVQAAIDACPDGEHLFIFVKNGIYNEKVMIGSHSVSSKKQLSVIGESPEGVIITWNDYNGKAIVYDGKEVTSGTPQSATFTVNAEDFYAENITIENTYTQAQAVALYNVADRQTFKNCRLLGYQDTHYLKKARRSYFLNCYIEGATDYICAGGTAIFDNCTIHSIKNGSYITAPEDITAAITDNGIKYMYGFIFRDCILTAGEGVEVYLGRPWQGTSSSVYLSCKMGCVKPQGWATWSGNNHLTSFFAEYNSMDASGNPLDISSRVDWSYQLTADEVWRLYTDEKIYSFVSAAYNPYALVVPPVAPLGLKIEDNRITWTEQTNTKRYLILKDGTEIAQVKTNSYAPAEAGSYSVKAVGANGDISQASETIQWTPDNIDTVSPSGNVRYRNGELTVPAGATVEVYSTAGRLLKRSNQTTVRLDGFNKGVYLALIKINGRVNTLKIVVE